MASIQRYKDRWRALVLFEGKRRSKVFETKREAQKWALETESRKDAPDKGKSFGDAVDRYFKTISIHKRGRGPEWEQRRFAVMLDYFGSDTRLSAITSRVIGEWRDHRLKTVQGSTILREANLLRHVFSVAVDEWQWLDRSPFKGVRLPKPNEARKAVWHWQDIKRVLRAGQRTGGKTAEVAHAFHIALRTGMRLQEVLQAPQAFDPKRRVVAVVTKTSRVPEEVPIGRIAAKLIQGTEFSVDAGNASALFSKLLKSRGIRGLTFHDARASALTLLARKVDVMTLARISRHKDISLLQRVYYRETNDSIARRL